MYNVLYIQCTMYSVLYTVYSVQCTVYSALSDLLTLFPQGCCSEVSWEEEALDQQSPGWEISDAGREQQSSCELKLLPFTPHTVSEALQRNPAPYLNLSPSHESLTIARLWLRYGALFRWSLLKLCACTSVLGKCQSDFNFHEACWAPLLTGFLF